MDPIVLQIDGSNFLPWSIHVLNTFQTISPLVEQIVDASIPHSIDDWFSYKNIPKEEEIYVHLNALAANVILSTLSVEVQDEAIYNGQTPPSSAHIIWVKLFELYGKPNDNECYVWKTKDNMSTILHCNEETLGILKSAESKPIKADVAVLAV